MKNLSNEQLLPIESQTSKVIEYVLNHDDDGPFCLKQVDEEGKYYLRQDKNGYCLISFYYSMPNVCCEDKNSNGYKRIVYKGKKVLKHRLIYKIYGYIPYGVIFEKMEVHHKNGNFLDNRLENLYLISKENHRILHNLIDKYGIENVEIKEQVLYSIQTEQED